MRGRLSGAEADIISKEIEDLQMFLSNNKHPYNLILYNLKSDLHRIPNYDVALVLLLEHCADKIESKLYLLPSEFHQLHRMLPYFIFLLDSDEKGAKSLNAFKSGKIRNLSRYQKLFKSMPFVPLYGDMQIDAIYVLRRCVHWEEDSMIKDWTTAKPSKLNSIFRFPCY